MMDTGDKANIKEEYEKILSIIADCTDDYIFLFDLTNDYYRVSESILDKFDLPSSRFFNATEHIMKVVYPEDRDKLSADVEKIVSGQKLKHNLEYRWVDREGKVAWINCSGKLIDLGMDSKVLVGRIHRLGMRRTADDLTGLLSEAHFKTNYEKFVQNNLDLHSSFIMLGIDNLKDINQRFGLSGGDKALKYVSEAIERCNDMVRRVYRMDGDVFAVSIKGDSQYAKQVYSAIRESLDNIIGENDYEIFFTISAGIVDMEKDMTFNMLKVKLEFALYQAKKKGRNCVAIYNEESYNQYMKLLDINDLLRESINNNFDGYEVYYQPIVDSAAGKLIGAEALLRWRCDKYGSLSPAQFIPILEESGLIIPVGKWVSYMAIKQCKEWQKFIPDFKININLSYIQIKKSNVALDILNLVNQIGIDPKYLTFEFTESTYIENDVIVRKLINTFNNQGIKLALDDFGTGYSNLAYLQDLNVDVIKIDRSFVNKAMQDENIYSVIRHIIDMAHNLNLSVCIEGIESENEQDKICRLVPDSMQGYLYGKPVPAEQFMRDNILAAM